MAKISIEEAKEAYKTILAFGAQSFNADYTPSNAEKTACALVKMESYEPDFVFGCAEEMFTQINERDIAEYLREA